MNLIIFMVILLLQFLLSVSSTKEWNTYPESQETYCPQVLSTGIEGQEVIDVYDDHRNLIEFKVSPDGKKIGELYSWKLQTGGPDYDFFVYDINSTVTKKLFSANYSFSSWEWLDANRIRLKMGCGTNCVAFKIISPGDMFEDYRKGSGEDWWVESPGYEPPAT